MKIKVIYFLQSRISRKKTKPQDPEKKIKK